jgi:hypothetical protein
MEYLARYLVHTHINFDGKLDLEEFIDKSIVELAAAVPTQPVRDTFEGTFALLNAAYGENALRGFNNGHPTGRVLLAAYECIAIGIARNLTAIQAKGRSDTVHPGAHRSVLAIARPASSFRRPPKGEALQGNRARIGFHRPRQDEAGLCAGRPDLPYRACASRQTRSPSKPIAEWYSISN